ncbi:hypothetical protein CgunFtcFv8_027416 [Champsocephalus gunnari]|uniref:Uncharacterized protein n=1 Tax=Champsocephalus gunnari TaxID=52237 RepID=A0AAN8HX30_CHAGU|nr:hypothetical protein CgunFtcFv8_027416 [Champsocephalus gunnari]
MGTRCPLRNPPTLCGGGSAQTPPISLSRSPPLFSPLSLGQMDVNQQQFGRPAEIYFLFRLNTKSSQNGRVPV